MFAEFFAQFVVELAFRGAVYGVFGAAFRSESDPGVLDGSANREPKEQYRPPPFERPTFVSAPEYYEQLLTLNDVVGVLNKRYPVKLAQCALPLIVAAAKVDGNFSSIEREFVRASAHRLFDESVSPTWIDDMIALHTQVALDKDQRDDLLRELNLFSTEIERWAVLQVCVAVAWRDGVVSPPEREFSKRLGAEMRLPAELVAEMIDPRTKEPEPEKSPTAPDERTSALLVMGLSATSTAEHVEQRFRVLALKLHPDRMVHADEKTREAATKRFVEVNVAYQKLKFG